MPPTTTTPADPANAPPDGVTLTFRRALAAPPPLVWRMWTEPEHFARWFGPAFFEILHCRMDVRPGGALHFLHRDPAGADVWVRGTFREVVAPSWLVFTVGFSDAEGRAVPRPGFALESVVSVTLAEADGGTMMEVRHSGLAVDQGESEGWRMGLDRLPAALEAAR